MSSLRPHNDGDRAGVENHDASIQAAVRSLPPQGASSHISTLCSHLAQHPQQPPSTPQRRPDPTAQYRNSFMEFPGGPVVRPWHFHSRGPGSISVWGTEIQKAAWHSQKINKNKNQNSTKKKKKKKEIAPVNKAPCRSGEGTKIPKAACFSSTGGNCLHHPPPQFLSYPYSNPSSTPAEALKSDGLGFDSRLCLSSWVTLSIRS